MFPKKDNVSNSKWLLISNVSYLGIMQIVNYVFPFITIPYLVKTLSQEAFGYYSLVLIGMSYLTILVDYGFNLTATRDIAVNKGNSGVIDNITSNIFYLKAALLLLIVLAGCVLYFINVLPLPVVLSVFIFVLGQALFPLWFLQGMENMRSITVFNAISKTLSTICVFLFVKKTNDQYAALLFYSLGTLFAGILSFFYVLKKYRVSFVKVDVSSIKKLTSDGFDIFLTSLFSNVIINGGTLVLGFFGGKSIVGIYSAIEKIARAIIGVLSAVTQVIFPNIARTLATDKRAGIQKILKVGSTFLLVISVGLVGFMFFSKQTLHLLYGIGYDKYYYILCVLLIWVVVAFLNNFIGIQFLVGIGYNKYYRKAFLITSFYIVLSFIGIKLFLLDGLVFSILSGEVFLTVYMLYLISKNRLTSA